MLSSQQRELHADPPWMVWNCWTRAGVSVSLRSLEPQSITAAAAARRLHPNKKLCLVFDRRVEGIMAVVSSSLWRVVSACSPFVPQALGLEHGTAAALG